MQIYLSETICYDTKLDKIFDGNNELTLAEKRFPFLKLLLKNKGNYVSREEITNVLYPEEGVGYYSRKNLNSLKFQINKNLVDWGLPDGLIEYDKRSDQYRIKIYNILEDTPTGNDGFIDETFFLTKNTLSNATTETVIGREKELQDILNYFHRQNHNRSISIYGFGGVGKTSFVCLLLSYLQAEENYDYIGIMNYHIDLKNSMVESIEMEDSFDESVFEDNVNRKWRYIAKRLKNSFKKKLFIIDNVDIDYERNQDPLSKSERIAFSEFTGWRNTDVIITSRIPDICSSFYNYELKNLGNDQDYEKCIELFYYYNRRIPKTDLNTKAILKLIKMASFNTMVIELLARSSVYVGDINSFYSNLLNIGFEYSNVLVSTMHDGDKGTIKNQLMNLFEMKKRTDIEKMILWDFHTLPEHTKVSYEELSEWLGYKTEELESLLDEGWIQNKDDQYSLHPLIRQAFQSNDTEWEQKFLTRCRIFKDRDKSLVEILQAKQFFRDSDSFETSIRKLMFADAIMHHGMFQTVSTLIYIADAARRKGLREIGVFYYKAAYDKAKKDVDNKGSLSNILLWKSAYYYGYMLSYTKAGMEKAEEMLKESLVVTEYFWQEERFKDVYLECIAASMDHLGYILSNRSPNDRKKVTEADFYLRAACFIRGILYVAHPNNMIYIHDYAWSLDNLGSLYACLDESEWHAPMDDNEFLITDEEIEVEKIYSQSYLQESLQIRRQIAKLWKISDSTEVAWTCCNLAILLTGAGAYEDAEQYLREAIDIYCRLEKKYPERHMSSEARTYVIYAELLKKNPDRIEEAKIYYRKALKLYRKLEQDSQGIYTVEINNLTKEIAKIN